MITDKTHVTIDGAMHKIARIAEHADGPAHTHRVHLGCGMTVDIDVGGAKALARAKERLGHVMAEPDPAVRAHHAPYHQKMIDEAALKAEPLDGGRWHVGAKAADCEACEAYEAGAPAVIPGLGHTPPTTRLADIETGIACPKCGTKIYKRRDGEQFACSGAGHAFTGPELMNHLQVSFESLLSHTTPETK